MAYTTGTNDYEALLNETDGLVRSYLELKDIKEWQKRNAADERLQKAYRGKPEQVLAAIQRRYLFEQEKGYKETPLLTVLGGKISAEFRLQLYYLHYVLAEPLAYDIIINVVAPKFQAGDTGVAKKPIEAFLDKQAEKHHEIAGWSPTIRARILNSFLGALKDFKIIGGQTGTEFAPAPWLPQTFAYVLYMIRDKKPKNWIEHKYWGLLYLGPGDILGWLRKADAEGYVIMDPKAAELEYACDNLQELAGELAKG